MPSAFVEFVGKEMNGSSASWHYWSDLAAAAAAVLPVVQWLKICAPSAGGPGFNPLSGC